MQAVFTHPGTLHGRQDSSFAMYSRKLTASANGNASTLDTPERKSSRPRGFQWGCMSLFVLIIVISCRELQRRGADIYILLAEDQTDCFLRETEQEQLLRPICTLSL